MKNPFRSKTKDCVRMTVHKDLKKLINSYQKRLQRSSDAKYGKNKFKVSSSYTTQKMARLFP